MKNIYRSLFISLLFLLIFVLNNHSVIGQTSSNTGSGWQCLGDSGTSATDLCYVDQQACLTDCVTTTAVGSTAGCRQTNCVSRAAPATCVQPPTGSCPTGQCWTGHNDAQGNPICNLTGTTPNPTPAPTPSPSPSPSPLPPPCPTAPSTGGNPAVSSYLTLITNLINSYLNRIGSATGSSGGSGLPCTPTPTPTPSPQPGGHSGGGGTVPVCATNYVWTPSVGGTPDSVCSCPVNYMWQFGTQSGLPYGGSARCVPIQQPTSPSCILSVSCQNANGSPVPLPSGGGTCESIGLDMLVECYLPSQSQASIACDRTYRDQKQSCLDQVNNLPQGGAPGTVNGAGLPSCSSAQPGQACTNSDGSAVRCRYSDQQDAFYCGQFGSAGNGTGYCLPGQTANCFPPPNCQNPPPVPGAQVACFD